MKLRLLLLPVVLSACAAALPLAAETCTTQSRMQPAERDGLVRSAQTIAALTAANNADGVKALTMPQFTTDFRGMADTIRSASPHLGNASFVPNTLWLLDASTAKLGPDGSPQDAQFFCNLNGGASQVNFLIPALPPGKYGMVVLDAVGGADPYQVATLLRENAPGQWQLGGLFARATTVNGHDGVWYWKTARDYAAKKQGWNAFAYYTEAESLLRPVSFLTSPHLERLADERTKAAPAALSNGVSTSQPLVIGDGKGAEIRVTSLGAEKAPGNGGIDLLAHVRADTQLNDPVASRARNLAAAKAIVAAYPELRSAFHGVWVVSEFADGTTYISEEAMTAL